MFTRWTANALFGRLGAPVQSATVTGGALHVNEANGVLVLTEGDVILALSSSQLTASEVMSAYKSTAAHNDTRARVQALRSQLGSFGAVFAFVLYDAAMGRVCAARTANSDPLSYGFAADGTLVAASGLTAADFFPEGGDAALELTSLPSGRFIFGHRYVKPIEFTQFWSTARTNRASVPARKAVETNENETCGISSSPAQQKYVNQSTPRRWGATGSFADNTSQWRHGAGETTKAPISSTFASTRTTSRFSDHKTMDVAPLPLSTSKSAYVPPAMRKAAAEAAAKAAAAAAAAEKAIAEEEEVRSVSPRTALRNADSQVAAAITLSENVASGLGSALASAFFKAAPPGAFTGTATKPRLSLEIPNAGQVQLGLFTAPARTARTVGSLRSRTMGSSEWEGALKTARASVDRATVRRSMESCARVSLDARRGSMEVNSRRGGAC